jgi:hypothetical protein
VFSVCFFGRSARIPKFWDLLRPSRIDGNVIGAFSDLAFISRRFQLFELNVVQEKKFRG